MIIHQVQGDTQHLRLLLSLKINYPEGPVLDCECLRVETREANSLYSNYIV